MRPLLTLLAAAALATGFAGAANAAPGRTDAGSPYTHIERASAHQPAPAYRRTTVRFSTNVDPGSVIVDTRSKHLYYVKDDGTAIRYGVGVGRDGFRWSGKMHVGRKAEWPSWTPPGRMIRREAKKGIQIPHHVKGGPNNPLGARALYLYRSGHDSLYRIHGTNQPRSIGKFMSSGCIRMMNQDVEDLYARVPKGTTVYVIGPGKREGRVYYRDLGSNRSIF
ncbi:L,D-transpeptidase [Pararhizobium mangrovi]|uniref:L,D-transpeptidase n=1 Tax=Pararhizobium mangrovi TaxID=2590452 RepID=A0A506TV12_9HYPH|nr:L,D-transpeptidase [Pararhizobium mangrovi]TPW25913.1 L,D-transpeptidase [Pararhizobium mangrovi]